MMGLETGTYIDDFVSTNPISSDPKGQGDDHLRLIKAILKTTFPRAAKPFPFHTALTKTANYTVLSTDEHTFFTGDGTSAAVGFTLPSLASADKGWYAVFRASNITNAVSIAPASGTINGAASLTFVFAGQTVIAWFDGTNWFAMSDAIVDVVDLTALTAPAVGDSLLIYDLSATANRKIALDQLFKIINGLTAETAPATDDVLPIYDTSEGAANSMTLVNLLTVLNALTEDTDPDEAADFLLSYDTSAATVKKVKPSNIAVPNGLVLIQSQVASNSVSLDFTGIDDTYDTYELVVSNLKPVTDDVELWIRVGTGAGPTYQTTNYDYAFYQDDSGSAGVGHESENTQSSINVGQSKNGGAAIGNAATRSVSGKITFDNPEDTTFHKLFAFAINYIDAGGNYHVSGGGGGWRATTAITAVRIMFESGNISSGRVSLYGYRKA